MHLRDVNETVRNYALFEYQSIRSADKTSHYDHCLKLRVSCSFLFKNIVFIVVKVKTKTIKIKNEPLFSTRWNFGVECIQEAKVLDL